MPGSPHEPPDEHVLHGDVAFVHGTLLHVEIASMNRVPRLGHADVLRLLRHLVSQVILGVGWARRRKGKARKEGVEIRIMS